MQVGLKTYFCRVFHTVAVSMEKGETVGGACSPRLQVSHNTPVQPNHQLVTLHVLALVSETNNNRVSFFVTTLVFLSTLHCFVRGSWLKVRGHGGNGRHEQAKYLLMCGETALGKLTRSCSHPVY